MLEINKLISKAIGTTQPNTDFRKNQYYIDLKSQYIGPQRKNLDNSVNCNQHRLTLENQSKNSGFFLLSTCMNMALKPNTQGPEDSNIRQQKCKATRVKINRILSPKIQVLKGIVLMVVGDQNKLQTRRYEAIKVGIQQGAKSHLSDEYSKTLESF